MWTLKLLNNWEEIARSRVRVWGAGGWKYVDFLKKRKIKEIKKMIAESDVIEKVEGKDGYTIYAEHRELNDDIEWF